MKTVAKTENRASSVVTERDLIEGLGRIEVDSGDVVLVHASMSSFGLVSGGEQAVLGALRRVVGTFGTIVMPAQSWQLCDPDFLDDPAMDAATRVRVRESLPAFDELLTPSRTMGRVAELFRLQPDTHRSPHPHRSFAAAGLEGRAVVAIHELDEPFGETSPLARLYDLEATVLLLGVGYEACTSLHLAEGRADPGRTRAMVGNGAPISVAGARQWVTWSEPVVDDGDFPSIGAEFEASGLVRSTTIGSATCRAMSMVDLVDFATGRMRGRNTI